MVRYTSWFTRGFYPVEAVIRPSYFSDLEKLLRSGDRYAIVFMEETDRMDRLKVKLKSKFPETTARSITVPTFRGSSMPFIAINGGRSVLMPDGNPREVFRRKFESAGVENVVIGGQWYDDISNTGCVGGALRNLEGRFNCVLSDNVVRYNEIEQ